MKPTLPLRTLSLCLLLTVPTTAQSPQTTPAPSAWSAGGITFSGLLDGYYSLNFNHPSTGANNLRYFDAKSNQFSLNMAKLSAEHSPDPIGFKLETIFGRASSLFNAAEPGGLDVYRHLLQAYLTVKPPNAKGLQLDFGKFVTSAGAEVTETHLNWNYSRGLLYANGPFYHFGARITAPVSSNLTLGYQLINGWNNIEDNNSGKTHGFTAAFTSHRLNLSHSYYAGPEKTNTNAGWRHFNDTVVAIYPNAHLSGLLNIDYGQESTPAAAPARFYGAMAAVRLRVSNAIAISPRYEWYRDASGLITGRPQTLQEATLTLEYKLTHGFLSRLEYRRDWSTQPVFDRGNQTGSERNQDTLLLGLLVVFGPR
jgi:hypothetical protein